MTLEELKVVARKRGKVVWTPSGTIEHVIVGKKGRILFRPLKKRDWHPIFAKGEPVRVDSDPSLTFNCSVVETSKVPK